MLDNNQKRVSVDETTYPSQENSTTLTPSSRATWEIASGFCPENKVRGKQRQRSLTNFFPHKNITYKKKVVVQEVNYSMYYVIVTDK